MLLGFSAAIDLLPLGTAVAIEFLGPLTVAALHSGSRRALLWPGLALVGVVLLTEPWKGNANLAGIAFAAFAGACWGLYIVITQHVGARFSGVDSLAISIPVAAIASAFIGIPPGMGGHIDLHVLLVASAAAVLLPIIPWTLELYALRRLTKSAFGTLAGIGTGHRPDNRRSRSPPSARARPVRGNRASCSPASQPNDVDGGTTTSPTRAIPIG